MTPTRGPPAGRRLGLLGPGALPPRLHPANHGGAGQTLAALDRDLLVVTVVQADGLLAMDHNGLSDPYVIVTLASTERDAKGLLVPWKHASLQAPEFLRDGRPRSHGSGSTVSQVRGSAVVWPRVGSEGGGGGGLVGHGAEKKTPTALAPRCPV
jgi:hypothetical protein